MALPEQIQRQVDQADALVQQMTAPAPAQEQPVEPVGEAADTQESEKPVVDAPEQTAVKAAEPQKNDEYAALEQRYRSLQGMWQSAEARLRKSQEQVTDLTEKLEQAIAKLDKLSSPEKKPEQGPLVTDKDAEAFGTDLVDLVRRGAREEATAREQALMDHIRRLEQAFEAQSQKIGSVVESQTMGAQERFYATLDSSLPQWEAIQATPEAQAWLSSQIPGTGYKWNDALIDAASKHDARRALEVFDAFLKAHPAHDPRRQPEVKQEPAQTRKADQLARQVAPSKSGAATSMPTGKKTYTAAEYAATMDRIVQLGKARQYTEADALEQELNAAMAEGRITP